MITKQELPTFAGIASLRLADAGPRDKIISIKVTINTAKMMVEAENALAERVKVLEAALTLAEAYVGKGVADRAFSGCAMSGERALDKISAALRGTRA